VKPRLSALLDERARCLSRVAEIDAELRTRGVRGVGTVLGRPRDASIALLRFLTHGPATVAEIQQATGQSKHAVEQMCSKLTIDGELRRVAVNTYALPEAS
jgi:hypothetical protein